MQTNNHERIFRASMQKLFKNKLATVCFFILLVEIILILLAPVIAPFNPDTADVTKKLAPGFWAKYNSDPAVARTYAPRHYLGTDHLGRDVLSRVLWGGRISLMVGFVSTVIGSVIGVTLGLLAGYYRRLDNPIMRVMDLLFTFPGILLAMLIIAAMGVSTFNAMIAISVWSIPGFARMIRGRVLQIKEEDYILAIRAIGARDSRIIFNHILKNCLPLVIVIATMRMAGSIISVSTLSYLGMGVPPPTSEWGGMIAQAKEHMWRRASLIIIPGIAVMITVICFNILGDKLRDVLDPSLKD
ncbi:peptide ABC transporter substrate-binding protein [Clostridia bacterium]|nr:peptide ABC transporter substrate-binding protein [Clostridia bacterium]